MKRTCRLMFAAASVAFLIPQSAVAQQAAPQVQVQASPIEAGRSTLRKVMEQHSIPGLSVAVMKGDQIVWSEGFGKADLEQNVPVTPETLFRTGSIAKVFTATLAAKLVEQGKLDLDVPVRTYVAEWPEKHPDITLRQLLGHMGGVRHYAGKDFDATQPGGLIDLRVYPDHASILALFAEDDLVAPPGTKHQYTTFGYSLVGIALEKAGGDDFYSLLKKHVLDPAGIDDVMVDGVFDIIPNRTAYYDPIARYEGLLPPTMGAVVRAMPINSAYKIPGGGLVATSVAIAKFGAAHYGPGLVGADMYREMMTNMKTPDGKEVMNGLGWRSARDEAGRLLLHHGGAQQGARAQLFVYPELKVSIAIMTNLGGTPDNIVEVTEQVIEPFLE